MSDLVLDRVLDLLRESDRDYINEAQPIAPRAISFDHAFGSRPVTSQTLLLRLPMELVQEVVTYLDIADLKSLALVDRDCKLLARPRLFTRVVLDYSGEKWELLEELSREAKERQNNGGVIEGPSIGACIRHLTVQTDAVVMECQHDIRIDILSSDCAARAKRKEVMKSYCGTYLPAIAQVLRFSLPNLEGLDWEDFIPIPQFMLTAIASSPIRHLGLHRAMLGSDCEYPVRPLNQWQRWALRSLDLWLLPAGDNHHSSDWSHMARFCKSFFEEVAPTLEKLSCDDRVFLEDYVIRFPKLHTLWLDTWTVAKDAAFESLFPAGVGNCALRFVAINSTRGLGSSCIWIWESLARRGHIPGLEALNLRQIHPAHELPVSNFLLANPQLRSLLMFSCKPLFLTTKILPFLASNLKLLTSLVVTLGRSMISSSILEAIGRISSLTSLWIALEEPIWEPKIWIVHHPPSIAALSPLQNLTRLALSEEAAGNTLPKSRLPEFDCWALTNRRKWGDEHSETVREVVEAYVKVVKSLRWVYLGQLVHTVVGDTVVLEDGGRRMYCPGEPWESSFVVGPGRSL